MQQKYEIIPFNERMPMQCVLHKIGYLEPHIHDYFEIDMVLSGNLRAVSDGQTYNLGAEDIITFDAHSVHELRGKDCILICVQFEQSLFEKTLPAPTRPRFFCNSSVQKNNPAFDGIRRLIAKIVKNNTELRSGYVLHNWSLIYELMDVLFNNFRVNTSHSQDAQNHRYAARMTEISKIMREHYMENFSLSMLADMLYLSAPYLSRFFDRQFGMSFSAYLTQLRINHALNELLNTNKNIEEISADSGFPNSHAFVSAFKREFGVLPSVYRRQNKLDEEEHPPAVPVVEYHDYMEGLAKYLTEEVKRPDPVNAISCSARFDGAAKAKKLRHTWKNIMCVTSAADLLLGDIRSVIKRVQREIKFNYVRFNGILSDDMHIYNETASGEPVYNFIFVDKIIDFLRSVNLKPFIQLSFMPALLAKDPGRRLFGYLVSEPRDLEKWCGLVMALVEHLISRYGEEEIVLWKFSVWNEPDTPPRLYGFSTDEDFYNFYKQTYITIKNISGKIQVGTPSTFYIIDEIHHTWYIDFFKWCCENGCKPDFFNFSYYDVVFPQDSDNVQGTFGFVDKMILRDTPGGLSSFADKVISERAKLGAAALPIYLTEWNTSPSQRDWLNDTCYKSCYIVKNILENYDRLESFGYWSLSDFMGEAPLPGETFFGGLGIFTVNGIPKAAYYALWLLGKLGDEFISNDEGWFATKKEKEYRIIMYNYRHISHLYAQGERFDMTFSDRYTLFAPEQLMDFHITINNIQSGKYLVRETILNRNSGSAFDKWVQSGALEIDSEQEFETLSAHSVPACRKYVIEAAENTLKLDALLDMLEVRLMTIEKISERSAL